MTFNKNEYMKKYRQTEKGKEVARRWGISDKAKIVNKKYRESEKGRATHKIYEASEKRKLAEKGYEQSDNVKAYRKKYHSSERGKAVTKKYDQSLAKKNYRKSESWKQAEMRYEQSEKRRIQEKNWWHSDKGKIANKRHNARRRKYDFIPICPNIVIDEKIVGHHINSIYTAYIPEDLHKLYGGANKEMHRFLCNQIVRQLYYETDDEIKLNGGDIARI
jgi:hypothetical protein